jgi:flagellar hook assembly protein FlgD
MSSRCVRQTIATSPNPFNSSTTLEYDIQEAGSVDIQIYDILGRTVMTETLSSQSPGVYNYTWNGQDNNGRDLASGVYQVRIVSGEKAMTRSVVMNR